MLRILFVAGLVSVACAADRPTFATASMTANRSGTLGYSMKVEAQPGPVRLKMTNVSLKFCVQQAWRVKEFQVLGPGWITGARYDITATLPTGAEPDQVWPALQALLAERLQVSIRRDTKEMRTYRLTAGKSGPNLRQGGTSMQVSLQSATLPKLCDELSDRIGHLVSDATGIPGTFDFDLHDAKPGDMSGPPIERAVEDQLGLRLEVRKSLVDIVVVEHAGRVPSRP